MIFIYGSPGSEGLLNLSQFGKSVIINDFHAFISRSNTWKPKTDHLILNIGNYGKTASGSALCDMLLSVNKNAQNASGQGTKWRITSQIVILRMKTGYDF